MFSFYSKVRIFCYCVQLNRANPVPSWLGPASSCLPPCRGGVVPVHHDPVHGIVTNPGNREWGRPPLSFFVVCAYPIHRVMVNWDPPISQYLGQPGGNQKGNHSIIYNTYTSTTAVLYCILYILYCNRIRVLVV